MVPAIAWIALLFAGALPLGEPVGLAQVICVALVLSGVMVVRRSKPTVADDHDACRTC